MQATRKMLRAVSALLFAALVALPTARAEWVRSDKAIGWSQGGSVVWQFSFDQKLGKPFFHPVSVPGQSSLTNFKPEDHPWHYGFWFSWKYINGVNYWEEDRASGKAEGKTQWGDPVIETDERGGATIKLAVRYVNPSGQVDVEEERVIVISAPAADGQYFFDWQARFTAGKQGAFLDRTPMPDEPRGQFNGGYGGLALRLASAPAELDVMTLRGTIVDFPQQRARPSAPAVAFNLRSGGHFMGGVAIFSDPANSGSDAPWYIVNAPEMRFACAAVLAPKPLKYAPGETWMLHYRVVVKATAWKAEELTLPPGGTKGE
jgi:hypothetical protein